MENLTNEQLRELLKEAVYVAETFQRAFSTVASGGPPVRNVPHVTEALKRLKKLTGE